MLCSKASLLEENPKIFLSSFSRIFLLAILLLASVKMPNAQNRSQSGLDSLHLLLQNTSSIDTNYVYHLIAIGKQYHDSNFDYALERICKYQNRLI